MRCLFALFCIIGLFIPANQPALADVVVILRTEPFSETTDGSQLSGGVVTLKNYGETPVDIYEWVKSQHWHAVKVENDLTSLAPGQTVSVTFRPMEQFDGSETDSQQFDLSSSLLGTLDGNYYSNDAPQSSPFDYMNRLDADETNDVNPLNNTAGSASIGEHTDDDDEGSAIAIPEPANILLFAILAVSGIAFAIWHRSSIQKSTDPNRNPTAEAR